MFGEPELKKIDINGTQLLCAVCRHDEFSEQEVLLNTEVMTFFNLDWANKKANCFVCNGCGYIHWFLLS